MRSSQLARPRPHASVATRPFGSRRPRTQQLLVACAFPHWASSASSSSSGGGDGGSSSGASSGSSAGEAPRRALLLGLAAAAASTALRPPPAAAVGFKKELKKRKVSLEDYAVSDLNGLRFFDNAEGRGKEVHAGDTVVVHFDCRFRGIDAVSSRYARTLGGNRTIAEPLEFVAGEDVTVVARKANDSAGGLFAGGSGPKPPPAISTAVIGMKGGGKRTVWVDVPELGYVKGNQEIPAGAAFELFVELLSVVPGKASSG